MYQLSNSLKKVYFLLIIFLLPFGSIAQDQKENKISIQKTGIELALQLSKDNRPEIEKLLQHYDKESLKFKAVCFLVENMQYHTFNSKDRSEDTILTKIINNADSLYYNLVKDKTIEEIQSKSTIDSIKKFNIFINGIKESDIDLFNNIPIENYEFSALENISSSFVIAHVDHAFEIREKIALVHELKFEEFCEHILSFQSIYGRNIHKNGKDLNLFFSKYLPEVTKENFPEVIKSLNLTISNFRKILGKYPYSYKLGFEELLFTGVPAWDCFDVTNFETSILNAVGIPTISEYNVAYKMLQGRHSQCSIHEDIGNYTLFALEGASTVPKLKEQFYDSFEGWMNIYRKHYSKQTNTPAFLKALNEEIPEELSSPLIEDITSLRMETTTIEIPFKIHTNNNLAYLGTFNSETGMVPVTWATIEKQSKMVSFKNVIPNRIYFPIYYEDNVIKSFSDPFIIRIDSSRKNKFVVQKFVSNKKGKKTKVSITSKFPRKPKMLDVAKKLIGTTVWASNHADFKNRDTLYSLNFELKPYLQDVSLNNTKPYRYYRIQTPAQNPNMNLSEVQFLTTNNYKNTTTATPLPILTFNIPLNKEPVLLRLLEDSLQKISKWPEYDGKMTTAPSAYPNITFRLKEPQIVTHLRIAPLNEDNGINVGDIYALFRWKEGQWQNVETTTANYNYLYNELNTNQLYWLRNLSRGKEELPFFIDKNGIQNFIYPY